MPTELTGLRKIDLTNFHVASSGTARDINRRIILDLIRTRQPISRADLARQTGLQRSTVSLITEQLIAERWICEGPVAHAPRGRRPTLLHLNVDRARIIGVDVRPGVTMIGLADPNGQFSTRESFPTNKEPDGFLCELARHINAWMQREPQIALEGIGVSLPGRVDLETGRLLFAPNLGWRNVLLQAPLERATGLPVVMENAANACALAEIWFGESRGAMRDLVVVTVSEGIGVGMIANGQLLRGAGGLAGEFGHVALNEVGGPRCVCGNVGCWEAYASNRATLAWYHDREGVRKRKVTFAQLLDLAERGDATASEAMTRMGHYLGLGIAGLVTGLAPARVIVIGEFTRLWDRMEGPLSRVVQARAPLARATVVPGKDGEHARLRGTVALVMQQHFGLPA
jgi:predicted NBD/HSP70 family sugar kinase